MSFLSWIQSLRENIAQKQSVRSGTGAAIIVSEVMNGIAISSSTITDGNGFPDHFAAALSPTAFALDHEPADQVEAEEIPIRYLADVPAEVRERIQDETVMRVIRRLETPLRALYMATSRKGLNCPADELRGFLTMWRQALGDYMGLVPDERSSLTYDRSVDEMYFVRGRCFPGTRLAILEPCWTIHGKVALRGEAVVIESESS